MIIFDPSKTSDLSLISVNEILKKGLEKNEEIAFYSGDIIKVFLKKKAERKRVEEYYFSQEGKRFEDYCFTQEQKNFIVLIKKLFFLKKAKILSFEKIDEKEIFMIKNYYKGEYTKYLAYFILSYLFLKKISKSINEIDILLKKLTEIDKTIFVEIIDFIIKNFDKNEIAEATENFILSLIKN